SITIKEPNSECQRPQCVEPQGFGAVKTRNGVAAASRQAAVFRVLKKRDARDENIVDVRTDLNTLDINEEFTSLPDALRHRSVSTEHEIGHPVIVATMNRGICMSVTGFTFASMLTLTVFTVATVIAITLLRSHSTKA
ncbi:unnamed protein product, partial [Acanthocheilonema viteae]